MTRNTPSRRNKFRFMNRKVRPDEALFSTEGPRGYGEAALGGAMTRKSSSRLNKFRFMNRKCYLRSGHCQVMIRIFPSSTLPPPITPHTIQPPHHHFPHPYHNSPTLRHPAQVLEYPRGTISFRTADKRSIRPFLPVSRHGQKYPAGTDPEDQRFRSATSRRT